METALPLILGLLGQVVPAISSTTLLGQVVTGLVEAVPIIIKTAPALIQDVKNIIATLKSNDAITDDQLAQLEASESVLDAAFETAAQAAEAEDAQGSSTAAQS